MKKGAILLVLVSIFLISFVIAQEHETQTIDDKAYSCLNERFNQTSCAGLSTEGKIFALLTLGECKDEILADSNYKTNIKLTSQAILALDKVDVDTTDAQDWLWAQNKTPTDMIWYLQIDTSAASECTITYAASTNTINIGEDKKLDSNAGSCLTRASGDYWLQVNPSCYNEEYEITCGESTDSLNFKTNLLFKNPNDNTIYVSPTTHSGDGGETTTEKIEISCFQKGISCDYEGTLWATSVLEHLGTTQDLAPIKFYLTSLYTTYPQYFPESFLYSLTGLNEFENKLFQYQNQDGSWKKGTNKYYDTALALLAVPSRSTHWENAILWLEDKQMDSGCWNSNSFVDTAFLVYSVWPRGISLSSVDDTTGEIISPEGESCTEAGYFCMAGVNCDGSVLDAYDCTGFDKCCSKKQELETCSDLNGDICNSNEQCVGGTSKNTFELDYGQNCCVDGACEEKTVLEDFSCEPSGGICRIGGCESGEEESFDTCEFNDSCCVIKTTEEEKNYLWAWILVFLILIGLVTLGIAKRNKLREYLFRLKSKFKKAPPTSPGRPRPIPIRRPVTPAATQRRLMQGRQSPVSRQPIRRPSRIARPSPRAPSEINDVLKKLKDMGK